MLAHAEPTESSRVRSAIGATRHAGGAARRQRSGAVIAVALTSREPRAGYPLTLESKARGLPERSWIKVGLVRTLAGERIGRASDEELARAIQALDEMIGA